MTIKYTGVGGGVPRKTAKIFAKNASNSDMTVFGSTLAGNTTYSSDLDSIQSNHYEVGWREGVISDLNYPLMSDMNAVQKTFSQQIAYSLQHGIPEWDANTTYYAYDIVQSGGVLYTSIVDQNTNNVVTDTTKWAVYYNPDEYLTKKQITNCILENPTDILLTLHEGVLKLYAGSKFYIPNGVNTFTEYTTSADITDVQTFTGQALVFPVVHNGVMSLSYYGQNSNVFISDTPPTSAVFPAGVTDGLWYDYVNNQFSQSTNAGATWINTGEIGFPIALIQCASTGIFNIIQVFNGFGYFGNFVYYTPGLKVLAPWGRNIDGTMNNIEYTTNKCYLQYFTPYQATDSTSVYFFINTADGTFTNIYMQDYYETPTQPIRTDTTIWYNTDYNAFDFKPQGAIGTVYWTEVPITKLFTAEITNGQITSLSANYPVNLVDSSHRSWIAHQSMPRSGGVYYTVGQTEASYTAYYDGYVLVDGYAMTDYDNYLYVFSEERAGLFANCLSSKSGYQAFIFIPIRAGATFRITYGNFNNLTCKLIPLNGGS